MKRVRQALTSLKLTITCLATLLVLVAACTLAQVELGTFGAVDRYIRSPLGALVGGALLLNLIAVMMWRLRRERGKVGLWLVHLGLALLIGGEFITALFSVETQLAFEEGQTRAYTEAPDEAELVVIDQSSAEHDEVYSVREGAVAREGALRVAGLPFTILVKRYWRNSEVTDRTEPMSPGARSIADRGVGTQISVRSAPPVSTDDRSNVPSAFVELVDGDRTLGTWLVSSALSVPQSISYLGRTFRLALRPTRHYLPFSLELKDFRHEKYPGTDIPKHFSSLVTLRDAGAERDVLIQMNEPLRHGGRTFYQASFGKDDTLSVLQVVKNPGWLVPYASCVMMALGLLLQFGTHLLAFLAKTPHPAAEAA